MATRWTMGMAAGPARQAVVAIVVSVALSTVVNALWLASVFRMGLAFNVTVIPNLLAHVLFLRWLYRAASDAARLRFSLSFTPTWAVASWFFPIVNLYRPFQMIRELHAASDPSAMSEPSVYRERAGAGYRDAALEPVPSSWERAAPIRTWWLLWATGGLWLVLGWMGANQTGLTVISTIVALAEGVLCALVVRAIDARQQERSLRLYGAARGTTALGSPAAATVERSPALEPSAASVPVATRVVESGDASHDGDDSRALYLDEATEHVRPDRGS